jgi:GT2 family glycosyltransferase
MISKGSTPFCLGGFMMIRSERFKKLGGFDEEVKVAEDYYFSKQIKPRKFGKINNSVFTPPRRFYNKGLFYMAKLFLGSFFNHNNKSYFTKDKNYW